MRIVLDQFVPRVLLANSKVFVHKVWNIHGWNVMTRRMLLEPLQKMTLQLVVN